MSYILIIAGIIIIYFSFLKPAKKNTEAYFSAKNALMAKYIFLNLSEVDKAKVLEQVDKIMLFGGTDREFLFTRSEAVQFLIISYAMSELRMNPNVYEWFPTVSRPLIVFMNPEANNHIKIAEDWFFENYREQLTLSN